MRKNGMGWERERLICFPKAEAEGRRSERVKSRHLAAVARVDKARTALELVGGQQQSSMERQ